MRRDIQISVVLVLITVGVYWQVHTFDFVGLDDPYYVTDNPHIRRGLSWEGVRWALTADLTSKTPYADYWQPVTFLSRMLDVELFGFNPAGHHLMNLLFHVVNVLLLFALLRRLTGAVWRSAFVAAIFAVHPLQVESVAWVTERKDVLSACLALLTLWCYVAYASRPSVGRYLLIMILFPLGLMAKPMLVTLPFVMLLLDYWPLSRVQLRRSEFKRVFGLIVEKVPMLVFSVLSVVLTWSNEPQRTSWKILLSYVPTSYVWYISKLIWPTNLGVRSQQSSLTLPAGQVATSTAILIAVFALAIWQARRRPYLTVGWLWTAGMLALVVGLNPHSDRFMYLPMIGLLICVAWSAAELVARWPRAKIVVTTLGVMTVTVCMVCACIQSRYWRNSISLFTRAIAVSPNNYKAHNNLGNTLLWQGNVDEAIAHFHEALRIKPDDEPSHVNLGNALAKQDKFDEAVAHFQTAVQYNRSSYSAHNNWGALLARMGRHDEGLAHFREAVRINPDFDLAQRNLGRALALQGNKQEAMAHFAAAARLKPDDAPAHYDLGRVLAELGDTAQAIAQYHEALRLAPDFTDAINSLAWLLATHPEAEFRDGQKAVELAERGCRFTDYKDPAILDTLAAAYAEAGRFDDAVRTANKALDEARTAADNDLTTEITARLELYKAGQPYRQP
jgi:tetratricopeptide (TPR) repeat protein